ncbi:MAG: adenosylcobinamide-GDP ribazoletransferase [Candidatus Omnitrophica bacterium]|nr:adenosylcobinamide-GDP ribazoletransferase [Candidatus Omnitrophota bacterium]
MSLLIALQFLTIIPLKLKNYSGARMASSAAYFPLAGLVIGLLLAGAEAAFSFLGFPALSVAVIITLMLALVTGGMHLDGLADTADALMSNKSKKDMLAIMRDPACGALGSFSITSALLLKIALLFPLGSCVKAPALVSMCVVSRWSAVFQMYAFPYAREEGKASPFIKEGKPRYLIVATLCAGIILFFLLKFAGLALLAFICLAAYLQGRFARRLFGGITGDTIGACIELCEIATLLYLNITTRSFLCVIP